MEKLSKLKQRVGEIAEELGFDEVWLEKGMEKGIELGKEQGMQLSTNIIVYKALSKGIKIEDIMEISGLTYDDIIKLKNSN